MPPQTRTRPTKNVKESVDVVKTKAKGNGKITKPPRKALADKTNSLSDDNSSTDVRQTRTSKVALKNKAAKSDPKSVPKDDVRPRRNRRLPTRYVENEVLINLSINKNNSIDHNFTKSQTKDTSSSSKDKASPDSNNNNSKGKRILTKKVLSTKSPRKPSTKSPRNLSTKSPRNLSTKSPRNLSIKAPKKLSTKSPSKPISPKADTKITFGKRLLEKNLSFRVFEDRKSEDKDEDIYEFTYDPNEEPVPQKKKCKKVVKKRPPRPKTVVLKNNYEKNLKITLESLKNKIKPSPSQNTQPQSQNIKPQSQNKHPQSQNIQPQSQNVQPQSQNVQHLLQNQALPQNVTHKKPTQKIHIIEDIILKPSTEKTLNYTPALPVNESGKSIHMSNYASICVEDIAADFEEMDNNDINYSPVSSPCRPKTPSIQAVDSFHTEKAPIAVDYRDPLNLQGDMSFDEQPVASSSMNVSVRHPQASPWRVEFGNLPIRWQVNTYVKPNMTPAVESSFINSEDTGKKHVYTNMLAEEPLPQIEEPNLKQTSIISFMREVAERSLKKKRGRSISPTKDNSLFEDMSNTHNFGFITPKKARKDMVISTPNISNSSNDKSCEKEVSNHSENHENSGNQNHDEISTREESKENVLIPKKSKNIENTYFGFDESESYDQENISPVKNIRHARTRGLRAKSRGVLQELNAISGPTRAVLPKPKLASLKVVEQLYHQLKTAEDAPILTEKENVADKAIDEPSDDDDYGQSVHLFEDIDVIHHLKPQRKSYGKAKKVTFRQRANSDSDTQTQIADARSSDEDDLADLSFQMPNVREKKVTKKKNKPKKQLSKKEEKEVEQWAAGFNSMCEDIDEFSLVVEQE